MIDRSIVTEQDLHDYIDGRLGPADRARVADHLAHHPHAAAKMEAYRAQAAGLHALYDKVLDEPLPQQMVLQLRHRRFSDIWRRRAVRLAAAVVLLLFSAAMGLWFAESLHTAPVSLSGLVAEAQQAHRLYSQDAQWASDFGGDRGPALVRSLSERMGTPIVLPDAERAGLTLQGARLVPTSVGSAAVLLYRDAQGRAFSLFIEPLMADDRRPYLVAGGDTTTIYRVAHGVGYALTLSASVVDSAVKAAFGMQPA